MLTKTRCMSLLDDIAGYAHRANIGPNGINEINEDYNELKKLIEEHFNPKPLEFKDLKEGRFYPIAIPNVGDKNEKHI